MIWVLVYALTGEIHSITSFLEGGQAIRAGLVGRVEFSVSRKKKCWFQTCVSSVLVVLVQWL